MRPHPGPRRPGPELVPVEHGLTSFDDLLAVDGLDVVDLSCTSPPAHVPLATAALDAGLHVICEKSLARFADAVRGDTGLPVTIAGARRSIELLTAIHPSAATCSPVELPLTTDHPAYHSGSIPPPPGDD